MSIVNFILRWATRVAFFFICMYPFNYGIDNATIVVLFLDFIFSCVALCRYSSDSLMKVIVGFDGDGDFGYYEYNDNIGVRVIGWFFWILSFATKIFMLYLCYLQIFCGGINF